MKHGAIVCAAFAALCWASQAMAQTASSDQADIQALEDRFAAAVTAKDVDAVMKVYAPGQDLFVFDLVPPRQYVGSNAYRKDWQDLFAAYPGAMKFSVGDLAVQSDGTLAYGHSIQHMSATDAKGKTSDVVVRVTDVYRKGPDGWRIVQEHVSVPVDFKTGKPDFTSAP